MNVYTFIVAFDCVGVQIHIVSSESPHIKLSTPMPLCIYRSIRKCLLRCKVLPAGFKMNSKVPKVIQIWLWWGKKVAITYITPPNMHVNKDFCSCMML